LFVTGDGRVFACGAAADGRLGVPASANQFLPLLVKGLDDHPVGQVACGDAFSVAVSKSGANAFWWGNVFQGAGKLVAPAKIDRFSARPISSVQAAGTTGMFLVGLSRDTTTGELAADASVYSWGSDAKTLGHGDNEPRSRPTLVDGLEGHGVIQIAVGLTHAGALTGDVRFCPSAAPQWLAGWLAGGGGVALTRHVRGGGRGAF
jgi:alpha-tubulin suppressor-like RCC1 family protein